MDHALGGDRTASAAGTDLPSRDLTQDAPARALAASLVARLRAEAWTLATAESCTGGLIAAYLTSVAGSSDAFLGGVVAYANAVKTGQLGVPEATLARHGAVSAETARAMAEGVRARLGADLALSVTGIAGPGGGSPGKPVGLVYIGLAGRAGTKTAEHRFAGDRDAIRLAAVRAALAGLLADAEALMFGSRQAR